METSVRGRLRPAVQSRDHILGSPSAPITLVEYGDFQSARCAEARSIVHELRRHFQRRLRFVFRNFPIIEVHPHALHAAEAAESVAVYGQPGSYWALYDVLFRHQQDSSDALDDAHLVRYAHEIGADGKRVARHLQARTFEALIRSDYFSGIRSGVIDVPTFFINESAFDGDWRDVRAFTEALESSATQRVLRRTDRFDGALAHVERRA